MLLAGVVALLGFFKISTILLLEKLLEIYTALISLRQQMTRPSAEVRWEVI